MVDETDVDADSVVGDECHINSGAPNGPRHDRAIDPQNIDRLTNLLLLCRVHHKMVDDQFETYTADLLCSIKTNHEQWVDAKFNEKNDTSQIRIRRLKSEIPAELKPVESGTALFNFVSGSHGSYLNHGDNLNNDEVEIVGSFLQNIKDWIDIAGDLEPIDRVRATKSLNDELNDLKSKGFLVFAAKEKQRLEGGVGEPSDFFALLVTVARETDPNICRQTE